MSIAISIFGALLWVVVAGILLFYGVLALHTYRKTREILAGQVAMAPELNPTQKKNFLRSYIWGVKQFFFLKALMMLVLTLIFLYFGIEFVSAICFCLAVVNFYKYRTMKIECATEEKLLLNPNSDGSDFGPCSSVIPVCEVDKKAVETVIDRQTTEISKLRR